MDLKLLVLWVYKDKSPESNTSVSMPRKKGYLNLERGILTRAEGTDESKAIWQGRISLGGERVIRSPRTILKMQVLSQALVRL